MSRVYRIEVIAKGISQTDFEGILNKLEINIFFCKKIIDTVFADLDVQLVSGVTKKQFKRSLMDECLKVSPKFRIRMKWNEIE